MSVHVTKSTQNGKAAIGECYVGNQAMPTDSIPIGIWNWNNFYIGALDWQEAGLIPCAKKNSAVFGLQLSLDRWSQK